MPANKNALLRYKTIDNCLRNRGRKWTLHDLVKACSDALYEYSGKDEYLGERTIQLDIQKMRSDELGYNAPIIVVDRKYYTYKDPSYSITNTPLTESDIRQMTEAVDILKQLSGFKGFSGMEDIVGRLQDHVSAVRHQRRTAIYFEQNNNVKGLNHLSILYDAIVENRPVIIEYKSFKAVKPSIIIFSPYILKEYRNRWFVFGEGERHRYVVNLALDRIISIENAPKGTKYKEDHSFDAETFFKNLIGVTKIPGKSDREVTVRFLANAKRAPYIETKPLHSSQMVAERHEDGSIIFQMKVCHNMELENILLEYGEDIKVLQPKLLAKAVASAHMRAAELYK